MFSHCHQFSKIVIMILYFSGLRNAVRTGNEKIINIDMENIEEEGYEKYLKVNKE